MIRSSEILNKDGLLISFSLPGSLSQTAAYYSIFFIANKAYEIISISEVHTTAGSDAGDVTLDIERLQGTTAPASGDGICKTEFDLKGTANTVVKKQGYTDLQNKKLNPGDRLALKDTGTLTDLEGVCITIYLKSIGKGSYN